MADFASLLIDNWYKAAIYLGLVIVIAASTTSATKYGGLGTGSLIVGAVVMTIEEGIHTWGSWIEAKETTGHHVGSWEKEEILRKSKPLLITHYIVSIIGLIIWIVLLSAWF